MYSNQVMLRVQAPPKPTLQYIGMIGRKRYNNDTAYFIEQGNATPIGRRLNDVVAGRFRLGGYFAERGCFRGRESRVSTSDTVDQDTNCERARRCSAESERIWTDRARWASDHGARDTRCRFCSAAASADAAKAASEYESGKTSAAQPARR